MDHDREATNQVKWWTGGYASHPTLQIGGDILVEPTMGELQWTLAQNGLI
jgi:mycoredoxin